MDEKQEESCRHEWESLQIYEVERLGKNGAVQRIDHREIAKCQLCEIERDSLLRHDHLGKLVL